MKKILVSILWIAVVAALYGQSSVALLVDAGASKYTINLSTTLNQVKWTGVTGQILTSAKITDINTFDKPNTVVISRFDGAMKQGDILNVALPPKSVVLLTIK